MGLTQAERKTKFESTFVLVRDELLSRLVEDGFPADIVTRIRLNLESIIQGRKLHSGMFVVDTAEILKGRTLTPDEFTKAAILAWSVELMQVYFLISDDLIDGSTMRPWKPCWYRVPVPSAASAKCPPNRVVAIADAQVIKAAVFQLLKTHFRKESYYADLVELFDDVAYKMEMGRLTDLVTASSDMAVLARFTIERYKTIVQFKNAFSSFYLPVVAAMYMCHIPRRYDVRLADETRSVNPYDLALSIFIPLGEYYQIQDDFLDYCGPTETLGKVGTDIVGSKCSWCITTALNLSTPEQRTILERNYGRKGDVEAGQAEDNSGVEGTEHTVDGLCEARVKQVYETIGLRKVFADYEQQVYRELNDLIDDIPEGGVIIDEKEQKVTSQACLKRELFRNILNKIYGRNH